MNSICVNPVTVDSIGGAPNSVDTSYSNSSEVNPSGVLTSGITSVNVYSEDITPRDVWSV